MTDDLQAATWAPLLAERMVAAATGLVDQLDAAQRGAVALPFATSGHRDWDYRPRARPGLPLRRMTEPQRAATWRLVETALSEAGIAKTRGVLALEAILQERTTNKDYRDPLNYSLAVFGRPGAGPWAWRFEGHHVSLTFTLVPGMGIAVTPHFFGANPFSGRVVQDGHGGLTRLLERESSLAFEIVGGLSAAALGRVLIAAEAPPDFLTGPGRESSLREPVGLPLTALPDDRRSRAVALIELFFDHLHADLAGPIKRRTRAAGLDGIRFAWAGATTPDRLHYWRLHGPTLLIEYDKTEPDHAHSVWHDPTNHFGEDHLRAHREAAHAHR